MLEFLTTETAEMAELHAKADVLIQKAKDAVAAYNIAVGENEGAGNAAKMARATEDFYAAQEDHDLVAQRYFLLSYKGLEFPFVEVARKRNYATFAMKIDNKTKSAKFMSANSKGDALTRVFDFDKVCEVLEIKDVKHPIFEFAQLLTIRAARRIEIPEEFTEKLFASYFMEGIKRQLENGETPTSNRQMEQRLQEIFDKLFGAGKCKAMSRDIAYLEVGFTQVNLRSGEIKTLNPKAICTLFLHAMHYALTNGEYTLRTTSKERFDLAEKTTDDEPTEVAAPVAEVPATAEKVEAPAAEEKPAKKPRKTKKAVAVA